MSTGSILAKKSNWVMLMVDFCIEMSNDNWLLQNRIKWKCQLFQKHQLRSVKKYQMINVNFEVYQTVPNEKETSTKHENHQLRNVNMS